MWPLFSLNQLSKIIGMTPVWLLWGSCLISHSAFSQNLSSPLEIKTQDLKYPGIFQTFEELIKIDEQKFTKKGQLLNKNVKNIKDLDGIQKLDLDPDFLNSIILHSDPGFLKLGSRHKCFLYDLIITDLIKNTGGQINDVYVTYVNKSGERESALINKKDFLNKVVINECPETQKMINQFQLKNIDAVMAQTQLPMPVSREQCHNILLDWLSSPKTAYLCQLNQVMEDAKRPNTIKDLKAAAARSAMATILEKKLSLSQKDYLSHLCNHLDDEELFCDEFLSVSFWSKVLAGTKSDLYLRSLCPTMAQTGAVSVASIKSCIGELKRNPEKCLFPATGQAGLVPQMDCEQLSKALNYSSINADYRDCAGTNDQQAVMNLARIYRHFEPTPEVEVQGPCSVRATATAYDFIKRFETEETWSLNTCYDDRVNNKEVCLKTIVGSHPSKPESLTNVIATILKNTRGAERNLTCRMLEANKFNPNILEFKTGCFIVYRPETCYSSQCQFKVFFNDREVTFIKQQNKIFFNYFPLNIQDERFSQSYILTHDYKKTGVSINNLTKLKEFFKKHPKGLIHGMTCAEEILPSYFGSTALGQCTVLPILIDGLVEEEGSMSLVVRTGADSLQAPRLISWSQVFSGIKSYQSKHPIRLWTLNGIY